MWVGPSFEGFRLIEVLKPIKTSIMRSLGVTITTYSGEFIHISKAEDISKAAHIEHFEFFKPVMESYFRDPSQFWVTFSIGNSRMEASQIKKHTFEYAQYTESNRKK